MFRYLILGGVYLVFGNVFFYRTWIFFWLILSCVDVFYVSLCGPSKGTLLCYTSICDGIVWDSVFVS